MVQKKWPCKPKCQPNGTTHKNLDFLLVVHYFQIRKNVDIQIHVHMLCTYTHCIHNKYTYMQYVYTYTETCVIYLHTHTHILYILRCDTVNTIRSVTHQPAVWNRHSNDNPKTHCLSLNQSLRQHVSDPRKPWLGAERVPATQMTTAKTHCTHDSSAKIQCWLVVIPANELADFQT